jgi:hypothetical protein
MFMPDYSIREVLDMVLKGQLRIPTFQRGFVWEPYRVAFFMDSLYKGYPFGSLLFWRTKEPLKSERQLGPFVLPERDPDYPVDYVLDGQQRVTSVFGVFQTDLQPQVTSPWTNIFFDYRVDPNAQETQFVALDDAEVDPDRHFPLNSLFDTVAYRRATRTFDDQLAKSIDELQARFKEARLPVEITSTEDRAVVAIIFERVNRAGVPLDTLQLLSAWTWSEEFALQDRFAELADELKPFGFHEVGQDANLLLRCCAAIIAHDASPQTLVGLNGATVRDRFQEIVNGIKGAIDFLRDNLNVHCLDNLPYSAALVPLSVFFAVPGNQHATYRDPQRRTITRWFWRCCFSKRYSSGVLRNLKIDIEEIFKLKNNQKSDLGVFNASVDSDYFHGNQFRINSVNTKVFILQLAQKLPLSFITGAAVSLREVLRDCNRNEFHHLFPRAYLEGRKTDAAIVNCLANFCFLSRGDNSQLGGQAPSVYRTKMPANVDEILARSSCPAYLFQDNLSMFLNGRAEMLAEEAKRLIQ